jgi:septum formation protein
VRKVTAPHAWSAPPLILASTSTYRRELLARLGIPFEAVAPAIDEEALKDDSLSPRELAELLACAKAQSLVAAHPDAILLGSDQTCACDGRILHKPGDFEGACHQLAFLSGKTHELTTAICILHGERVWRHTDVTRLTMRRLSSSEIERYVAHDRPFDCVGAYKLEQRGISLFESIASEDHTAITGLPLLAVARLLREAGYALP